MRGFRFSVLTGGYSVDIPHPQYVFYLEIEYRSSYRSQFFTQLRKTRIFPNYDLFHDFLKYVNRTEGNHAVVPFCKHHTFQTRRVVFYSDFKKKPSYTCLLKPGSW